MEDQAAIGVAAVLILFILVGVLATRANVITAAFMNSIRAALRTRTAVISLVVLIMALLLFGIARYGLVNSLPTEQHVERNRENNQYVITEDKDGCIDMRKLGRSNNVYMAVAPCKPGDKDKDKQNQPQQPKN
jgi:hypothetical protein